MARTLLDVRTYFESRRENFTKKKIQTEKLIRRFSVLRIISFLSTIFFIYMASGIGWSVLLSGGLIGTGCFIYFIINQSKLIKNKEMLEAMVDINTTELALLTRKEVSKPDGDQFMSTDHPYAADLDIFGKKSLFQLIDRCATQAGTEKLAFRLNKLLNNKERLLSRQNAIRELMNKPDWRQQFQAVGKLSQDSISSISEINEWAQNQDNDFNHWFYKIMLVVNPLLGILVVFLVSFSVVNYSAFLLFLFLPFFIIIPRLSIINRQHACISNKSEMLRKYVNLFTLFETENFDSTIMTGIKNQLTADEISASVSINRLSKISAAFDYRLNLLVGIFLNIFFLWDILQCIRLNNWKKKYGVRVNELFDCIAETDELSSFSGFAFSHPDAVFPEISEQNFELVATNAKHPLLDQQKCVGNDINIRQFGQFRIITGANMAGKSTYLRTVGINLVLAMTGAPVIAEKFIFKPVELFTGIKTMDSLQDGESYFFAELKRLKEIIDHLENGNQIFVILDEILRGTNSADKQKGSKALITQLIKMKASGLIATHDLSLGELAILFPEQVSNQRFEVEINQNELVFDYKLKEGVSQNLNATFLMKKMGITL